MPSETASFHTCQTESRDGLKRLCIALGIDAYGIHIAMSQKVRDFLQR